MDERTAANSRVRRVRLELLRGSVAELLSELQELADHIPAHRCKTVTLIAYGLRLARSGLKELIDDTTTGADDGIHAHWSDPDA